MAYLYTSGIVDEQNSSQATLGANALFKGVSRFVAPFPSVTVSCFADAPGELSIEFSVNGSSWQQYILLSVPASERIIQRVTVNSAYFRINYINGTLAQTAFELQTILGEQAQETLPLSQQAKCHSGSSLVRVNDFNLDVSRRLYQGLTTTIKDGFTPPFNTNATPIDITGLAGAYTGFPQTAPQLAEIVVAGADTGKLYYSYMKDDTDTDYIFASVNIAGVGTYPLGHNIWRCNFAYFESSTLSAFNAGNITIRHTATPANVFCVIAAGFSQSFCSAYTVPKGSQIFIDKITGGVRNSASGSCDGYFYYREHGKSPRLRFAFELQFGSSYSDDTDYLIRIPELTDIVPRIQVSTANGLVARISYRIIKQANM